MLLLIDSGNTRLKWAVVDPHKSLQPYQNKQAADWTASGVVLQSELDNLAKSWQALSVSRAVVANVAGVDRQQRLAQLLHTACALQPSQIDWFASVAMASGVRNGYREPSQLGCDRFASLIGARALFPTQPLIVATCGTATTIDALDLDGHFLGGLILPGLGLMATSLAQQTAQLPRIGDTFVVPPLFAVDTDAAIRSGCLAAQAGAITRAVHAHHGAQCILSGGAAQFIAPMLATPYRLIDNLVLLGLQAATTPTAPC